MTAVAVPSPDVLRRLAALLAVLTVALLAPASAHALTYCVKPATNEACIQTFPNMTKAIDAADKHAGDDTVYRRINGKQSTIPVPEVKPPAPLPAPDGPSVF